MGSSTTVHCCIAVILCSLALTSAASSCSKQWLNVVEEETRTLFPGGLSNIQLGLVASNIKAVQHQQGRPANLLVFGVGDDSTIWQKVNCDGKTVFLDNNADWISETRSKHPGIEVYQVEYTGSMRNSRAFYSDPWMIQLPEVVTNNCWDVIYVDSPAGYDPPNFPGRMESIYTSIKLSEQCINAGQLDTAMIYIHNARRSAEQEVVQQLLLPHPMVQPIGTMDGIGHLMHIAGFVVSKQRVPAVAHDAAFAGFPLCRDRCNWADVVWDMTHGKYGRLPQMSTAHVAVVAASVRSAQYHNGRRPNLLVFGVGYDSVGWSMANSEGRTVFLEDNDEWMQKVAASYPQLQISKVSYKGELRSSETFLDKPLLMQLPADVTDSCWDTILVDGPMGSPEVGQQGRMESSYAAIKLAEKCVASGQLGSVSIFLHDAGRPLEKEIMKKLFATHAWVESMGVLNGAGSRLLAGYVVTQHQQPEKHRGPDNKESATFPQNGNQQQQQQKLHSTRMADDQWTHFPGAAIVPAAYGASSSHWSVPAYPFLSHLGYLLLGIICGVMLRSWCRGLGQRKHVAGSLYIPIRSS